MTNTPLPPTTPQIKNSALAIWSRVLGILGLVFCICIGPLFAIPAVICGHMALARVKRSDGALGGGDIALTGLIFGYLGIGLFILMIALEAAIAIPNFSKARETARRNTCINHLRLIDGAKQEWALDNKKTADDIPTPQDLQKYLQVPFESLHCPAGGTYTINKVGEPPTCSVHGNAVPHPAP